MEREKDREKMAVYSNKIKSLDVVTGFHMHFDTRCQCRRQLMHARFASCLLPSQSAAVRDVLPMRLAAVPECAIYQLRRAQNDGARTSADAAKKPLKRQISDFT